ncbi:NAD-dependent epimerase/dehydratase family protein, partial [bacterium]|nr:NAD-dependent epimerase/dehydratase family protein [bacterium]
MRPTLPETIKNEEHLEALLSEPTSAVVEWASKLDGDILVLGAGGKMGPTLSKMAQKAIHQAGGSNQVIAVSRFSNPKAREDLQNNGVKTILCDIMDRASLESLPKTPYVMYMVGQKFQTTSQAEKTWALNVFLPGLVAEHFHESHIAAFSTGNVYPLVPVETGGSKETDELGPVGEYAQSCLGRERMFQYVSGMHGTRVTIIRLNYAVEMRYGVLLDIAQKVYNETPIDVSMGYFNVIWQGDANAYALLAFQLCQSPPQILNTTGPDILSIRSIAEKFGERFNKTPIFTGSEAETALLNNAEKSFNLFGQPT